MTQHRFAPWAERLLAAEAAEVSAGSDLNVAVRVSEKLRICLTQFVGTDGFIALQKRALVLARADVPSLEKVTVAADGRLAGLEAVAENGAAATAITAHFLGLLVTFIGEPLALRLMHDAFPDTPARMIVDPEESE